jgi:hypothetical protein
MKTGWRLFAVAAMVAIVVQGCAFTDSVVTLEYKTSDYTARVASPKEINVQQLTDDRGVDPTLICYKGVMHKTSGRYLNDRAVADFMTDAVKALLVALGYRVVNDGGDFNLSGQILKFDSYAIMGFWSGSLESNIQMNMKLQDARSRSMVWNEMLSAGGLVGGLQIDGEGYRKEVMDKAVDNILKKLAASATFESAVEGK